MFLAEFGTTSNADLPSRTRWTRFNRELAEHHGFSWGIWSLGPSFAIYDPTDHAFNPDLLAALIDEQTP
jgi:endoglucanase